MGTEPRRRPTSGNETTLHRLSDEERLWMIKLMTLLWGDEPNPDMEIGFDVSEQTTTMHLKPFYFVFEETPATDRPDSVLSVMGIHAYIARLPTSFDALVSHARTHPTIRALVLLFATSSLYYLQESLKPFVQVLAQAAETIELVLAYEKKDERRAVGVDLATLEPNGRIWTDLPVMTDDIYDPEDHLKSLLILQRVLKKKNRASAH